MGRKGKRGEEKVDMDDLRVDLLSAGAFFRHSCTQTQGTFPSITDGVAEHMTSVRYAGGESVNPQPLCLSLWVPSPLSAAPQPGTSDHHTDSCIEYILSHRLLVGSARAQNSVNLSN